MKKSLFIILIFMPFLLVACGNSGSQSSSEESMAVRDGQPNMVTEDMEMAVDSGQKDSPENYTSDQRLVAYEADLSVVVKGIESKIEKIQKQVTHTGGFIIESAVYEVGEGRKNARIVVRVPQPSFEEFLDFIELQSEQVLERNIQGQDVTEEYVDLDSRLTAKKVVEKRLLSFMENAETTEDLLKISNELGTVQQQIEQIEGKLKYLRNRTEYSSVSIYLRDSEVVVPSLNTNDLNTWEQSKKMFVETINGIRGVSSAIFIFLVGFSPVWAIVIVLIVIPWLVLKRKKKNNSE